MATPDRMRPVDASLEVWKKSLCMTVDIGGLVSRNPLAHKWKAPYRSLALREGVAWRTQDLLEQSLVLYDSNHLLGARILLRSGFESVAMLIYLNQLVRSVLSGALDFHVFSDKTVALLLGSRDASTPYKSLNIKTILERCNSRYPGIYDLYAALSESAHPNYEGMSIGYSTSDKVSYVTTFSNKWKEMYGVGHIDLVLTCIRLFYDEYNNEWQDAFEKLERWITENDTVLESTRREA